MRKIVCLVTVIMIGIALPQVSPAAPGSGIAKLMPLEEPGISVGPGFSIIPGGKKMGYSVTMDAAFCWGIFGLSANLKMISKDDISVFGASLEANAVLYVLNVAGGIGYFAGDENDVMFHVFVGVPIPIHRLFEKSFFKTPLIQPYYRHNWFAGKKWHEVGLMVKMMTW